jgi:lysozyme family protein
MAAANFAAWLKLELTFEGGRVDDPQDPGGRTAFGVTARVYNGYRKKRGLPLRDVFLIEAQEIKDIYDAGYWDKVRGDELPDGLDIVVADGAINSGVGQSVKWLQRALGEGYRGRVDGIMGDTTVAAAKGVDDVDKLIADVLARRMAFLRSLKTFKRFGRGWTSRVDQLRKIGQARATGSVGPAPVKAPEMYRKALLEDAKAPIPKADAVWGAGASGGTIAQAIEVLTPVSDRMPSLGTILTILTALGVVLTIAGLLYRDWAKSRNDALTDALDTRPRLRVDTSANDEAPEGLEEQPA